MSSFLSLHGRCAATALVLVALAPSLANAQESSDTARHANLDLSVAAADAKSPWTITLTNKSAFAVRVLADMRNLSFRVRSPQSKAYVECSLPRAMRPGASDRSLLLAPGARYEETIDPRLFCFGASLDRMTSGSSVTAFLGFTPDAKRTKAHKPQVAPFVAEPASELDFEPIKQLSSLTVWLGSDATEERAEDSVRERGVPKLVLHTARLSDAYALRDASVSATLRNVGDKAALIHVRTDNLVLQIRRPDGRELTCGGSQRRAVARDFFHSLGPGSSESVSVLFGEICPRTFFTTPGIYEVSATFHATESGREYGFSAVTGEFSSASTTLVRLQTASSGFYRAAPVAK